MTEQEAFDKAVKHLLEQNCRAMSPGGNLCQYRGQDGTKCAIGAIIPDDKYVPDMEGLSADSLYENYPTLFKGLSSNFLEELQSIHDDFYPEEWKDELKSFAKDFNLEWNHD